MAEQSARKEDINGFIEVENNPISKVGVFPYLGKSIGAPDDQAEKIFMVYRPEEELSDPECIKSFQLVPIIDEHEMLGSDPGMTPAEEKGVHGTTGEKVYFKDGRLYANLKIFSDTLQETIDKIKKDISLGYRCVYEFSSGIFDGVKYDAIQRDIRGNHLAIVGEGRMGRDVAVLDHMKFTVDSKELTKMAAKQKVSKIRAALDSIGKELDEVQKSLAFDEGEAQPGSLATIEAKLDAAMALLKHLEKQEAKEAAAQTASAEATVAGEGEEETTEVVGDEDPDKKEEEKAEDADEDKDEEKAEDADEDKSDEGKGMDKSEVAAMIVASNQGLLKSIGKRDQLAAKLVDHVGTFDHSQMTLAQVEQYGCKKLGLKAPKGHEGTALDTYLSIVKPAAPVFKIGGAQDSAQPGKVSAIRKHVNIA